MIVGNYRYVIQHISPIYFVFSLNYKQGSPDKRDVPSFFFASPDINKNIAPCWYLSRLRLTFILYTVLCGIAFCLDPDFINTISHVSRREIHTFLQDSISSFPESYICGATSSIRKQYTSRCPRCYIPVVCERMLLAKNKFLLLFFVLYNVFLHFVTVLLRKKVVPLCVNDGKLTKNEWLKLSRVNNSISGDIYGKQWVFIILYLIYGTEFEKRTWQETQIFAQVQIPSFAEDLK